MRFARLFVKQLWAQIPHHSFQFEDLEQAAYIGLMRAVDTFDAASGKSLRNWIVIKVRSAMLDYLREIDPLSRWQRKTHSAEDPVFVALENEEGVPLPFADAGPGPEHAAMAAELRARVMELPRRLRDMMLAHYWRDETLAAIARDHGISEGRVSQLLDKARRKLHESLSHQAVALPGHETTPSGSRSGLRLRRVLPAQARGPAQRVVAIDQRAAGRAARVSPLFVAGVRAVVRAGRGWERVAAHQAA